MVVFSNRRLGPSAELLLSPAIASAILHATATAAAPHAAARWEHELVRWLVDRATVGADGALDVADIAWTPEHFDAQRRFLIAAIGDAIDATPTHEPALRRWSQLVEAHPRDSVQVGRRWQWARADAVTA